MTGSASQQRSWLAAFTSIGKDLVALLRDSALFVLAVLLVAFPKQFNSILVDAGFEEGSVVGFKWRSGLLETNKRLEEAQTQITALQSKNDELLKALSEANQKADDPQVLAQLSALTEENRVLKSQTSIVQQNVSQTIESNIPLINKAETKSRGEEAVSSSGAFSGFSCGVSSYGGAWAEATRVRVREDLYTVYGCSEPPEAHSKPGYTGDFHTPTRQEGPWPGFAAKTVVLYYSTATKAKAEAVARDLSIRYGHTFVATRGGGQGILPEWYAKTIIVHVRESGS